MHFIDSITAVLGRFVKGNPTTGQKATQFTDEWCNAIQEEIANAVSMEGRALDKKDNAQLKKTLEGKFFSYTSRVVVPNAGEISLNSPGTLNVGISLDLLSAQKYDFHLSFNAKPSQYFADAEINVKVNGNGIVPQNLVVLLGAAGSRQHIMLHTVLEYNKSSKAVFHPVITFEVLNGTAVIDRVVIENVAVDLIAHNHA